MCSIIGYRGTKEAAPIIVRGLRRMEYRGYDSVGVATRTDDIISLRRGVGRVDEVNRSKKLEHMRGRSGIGHTRWATHGRITAENAHPHPSNSGEIAIVHNGIIENHEDLRRELEKRGYSFESETDSEVISNLLQENIGKHGGYKTAMQRTVAALRGDYAFVAIFKDGTLGAARLREPLIIGKKDDSYFVSSDVLGFVEYTDDAIYIENGTFLLVDSSGLHVYDFEGSESESQITKVSKEFADAYKGDYAHYTIKEISEQPSTIPRAGGAQDIIDGAAARIRDTRHAYITGSGTSYNAALVGKHILARHAKKKTETIMASELAFSPDMVEEDSVLVAMSQSGESADVLDAARIAREAGAEILSVVNMHTSSLASESSAVIGMNCGPEIGVAATKSFTAQIAVMYRIAEALSGSSIIDLEKVAGGVSSILAESDAIRGIAGELVNIRDIYVLGRGIHYPIALEAALKLKELAYIHAEGLAGGELKHGPLALMDEGSYVLLINPSDSTYADTQTSASEIKTRGARIIGISDKESDLYDRWIRIPASADEAYPITEMVPIQLLAYHLALEKDTDPDHPRNLAKSVTVR